MEIYRLDVALAGMYTGGVACSHELGMLAFGTATPSVVFASTRDGSLVDIVNVCQLPDWPHTGPVSLAPIAWLPGTDQCVISLSISLWHVGFYCYSLGSRGLASVGVLARAPASDVAVSRDRAAVLCKRERGYVMEIYDAGTVPWTLMSVRDTVLGDEHGGFVPMLCMRGITWAPGRNSLAFPGGRKDPDARWGIWLADIESGTATRLLPCSGPPLHPRFAPGGRTMAYATAAGRRDRSSITFADTASGATDSVRHEFPGAIDQCFDWLNDDELVAVTDARRFVVYRSGAGLNQGVRP